MKKFIILILFALMISISMTNFVSAEECIASNPSISIIPVNQTGNAGSTIIYSVYLRNNDNAYCNITDFNIRCSPYSGFQCNLVSSGGTEAASMIDANVPPGFNWTRTVKVTSFGNPVLGFSYPFTVTIDDGTFGRTITKSNSVTGYYTTPPLTVRCVDYDNSPDFAASGSYSSSSFYTKSYGTGIYAGASPDNNQIFGQEPNPLIGKPTSNNYSTYYDHCANSNQLNEAFCLTDGRLGAYGLNCPYGCVDGVCLNSSSPINTTCTDSDGGENYYVKGTINGLIHGDGMTTMVDSCWPHNFYGDGYDYVLEYYCLKDNTDGKIYISNNNVKCPNGCSDGVCLPKPQGSCVNHNECSQACDNEGTSFHWSGKGSSYRSWNGNCSAGVYGCMTGQCCLGQCPTSGTCFCQRTNQVDIYGSVCPTGSTCGQDCYCHSTQVNNTCTDSDGGKNYYSKGVIEGSMPPSFIAADVCLGSTNTLRETYCDLSDENNDGYYGTAYLYDCPYGCKDGACLPNTPTCTDSDGGENYYVKGYTTGPYYWHGQFDYSVTNVTDYCESDTDINSYLMENYCEDNGSRGWIRYLCPNGCKNGVCIKAESKCINHDECSKACDNLGISSKWMGYGNSRKFWEGSCPSSVYGCMTGQCCLGQCPTSGTCFCQRTNVVDIYGNVCPTGSTCGDDCYCHQTNESYKFSVKTDRYSYLPGEDMKITAVLSGKPSTDFSKAIITTNIGSTNVIMNPVGAGSSICTASAIGTTCSVSTEYYFVGTYNVPLDTPTGVYKIISTSILGDDKKNVVTNFQVGTNYNNYVDVSINPQEQYTMVGNQIKYDVTIKDSHSIMTCPYASNAESNCNPQIYSYLISIDGLPYHTVFPEVANVHAGGSTTIELKVFSSPAKTEEGIATTIQSATTSATTERSVSITGNPIATAASAQTTPIKDAVFKFSVKASLKGDSTVSDSATGILHVRFVELNESPPFQQQEKFNIDLVKGWNLISLPGKGIGFIQGTCSERPLAFVYLKNLEKYLSIDEALKSLGSNELLDHLSTHSFWVYSYEDCSIGFKVDSYSTYSGLALTKGWNLLGVTKDMTGETLGNIKGSCTFDKIYTWNKKTQTWVQRSENDLIDESINGMILQTEADCNLKTNTIQPPPFPSG